MTRQLFLGELLKLLAELPYRRRGRFVFGEVFLLILGRDQFEPLGQRRGFGF